MKKLLVLAALSAMAMGAKAEYTVYIPGAQAVYLLEGQVRTEARGFDWWNENRWMGGQDYRGLLLDEASLAYTSSATWAEHYNFMNGMLLSQETRFQEGPEGVFSIESGSHEDQNVGEALLLVLTDSDKLAPGASFTAYYGITDFGGDSFKLTSFESATLHTDSPTPAPEPTSGLLLLLGVAGLALKRKRA